MAGRDLRRHNQARKVMRNDGAAILCLSLLQPGWSVPPGSSITAGSAETVRAANKQSSQKRCTQKIHLHAERRPLWTPEPFSRNLEYTALIPACINAIQCLGVCFSKHMHDSIQSQPRAVWPFACFCLQAVSGGFEM